MSARALQDSDREADLFEIELHRKSALRGFLLGGGLLGLGVLVVLVTGFLYIGLLIVPGVGLLVNAFNHRSQASAIELRLHHHR